MNKKLLFLISFLLILPLFAMAALPTELSTTITNIKNLANIIGGVIVVIGWIIAGILYLTSMGGEKMATAKKAIWAAIIGTILIIIANVAATIIENALGGK
jgi:hypothetical protein